MGSPIRPRTCYPPEGFDGHPTDVEQVVAMLNAMPKPVTVPCFLDALQRPFELNATSNTFSAQPAFGPNNPRIFIFRDKLAIAVVTKGDGRPLVELGLERAHGRSLKAEIEFPVEAELPLEQPYLHLTEDETVSGEGTTCGFCHLGESRDPSIDFAPAYVSSMIPPAPNDRVDLDYLLWAWENCDPDAEPDRCAMFDAIFAQGEVSERPFPE